MKWKILLLLLCLQIPCFAAWYNNKWLYRKQLQVVHGKVTATLTDFPVYVNLGDISSGDGFWTHVLSTGADIRITKSDGTTEVPIEVTAINTTSKTGQMYFKAAGSDLNATTNASYYLYYGNGTAAAYATSATYGAQNVWDANYKAVYHLETDPSSSVADSTSTGNNLSSAGSMTSANVVTGKFGNAIDFDGVDDVLSSTSNVGITGNGNRTISGWISNKAGNADADCALYIGANSASAGYAVARSIAGNGFWSIWTHTGGTDTAGTHASNSDIGTFVYLVATYNSANSIIYYNGASDGNTATGSVNTTNSKIYLGDDAANLRYLASKIDEVRLSNTARSSTWISTEYNNQSSSSTFYYIGAEENVPVTTGNPTMFYSFF